MLKFNGNNVTKEYYINDYGNQIENFIKSVFLRIREIKFNEKFIIKESLYQSDYIIEIAKKIINSNTNIKFDNYEKNYKLLKTESLKHSMNLIKSDMQNLGIKHDNFFSETTLIENQLVEKSINKLKQNKYVQEGFRTLR